MNVIEYLPCKVGSNLWFVSGQTGKIKSAVITESGNYFNVEKYIGHQCYDVKIPFDKIGSGDAFLSCHECEDEIIRLKMA